MYKIKNNNNNSNNNNNNNNSYFSLAFLSLAPALLFSSVFQRFDCFIDFVTLFKIDFVTLFNI